MKHILAGSNGTNPQPVPIPTLIDTVRAEEIKNAAELNNLEGCILSVETTQCDGLFLLLDGTPVDPYEEGEERWMGPEYFTHQASDILSLDIWDELSDRYGSFPEGAFCIPDTDGTLRLYPPPPRQWRVLKDGMPARLWIAERDRWSSL